MTKASDAKPTVRKLVADRHGNELIVELRAATITLRPPRTRKGGPAEVTVSARGLYERELLRRVAPIPARKR